VTGFVAYCSGAQIKTRKRNIAVPLDPGSFADAVVQIFQDSKEGDDLEKNLQAAVKASYCYFAHRRILLSLILSRCSQAATTAGSRECRVRLFKIWRDTFRGPLCWR
jgi:uncharacterized protein YfaA (DUF2138 family)